MNIEEMFGIDKNTFPRINLSKAKVIRGQTFSQPKEMRMTLSPDGVQFSKSCIQIFEDFEYIEIMTIAEDHQIIIRKSDEYARNGLRWCKIKDGVRDSRKITGKDFGTGIYQRFGLNRGYRYKVRGSIALQESENDEYLLVFNMLEVDPFPMTTKARENAGVLNEELDEESLTELNRLEEERNRQKEERERAKAAGEKPKKMKSSRKSPWIENFSEDFDQYEQRIKIDHLDQASAAAHPKSAIQIRNRTMVDRSDLVVSCIEHNSGGAYQTVRYAEKQGKQVINAMDFENDTEFE